MPSSTFSNRHVTDHDAGAARHDSHSGRSGSMLRSILSTFRSRPHQALGTLDDHLLQDIGLTRADIAALHL